MLECTVSAVQSRQYRLECDVMSDERDVGVMGTQAKHETCGGRGELGGLLLLNFGRRGFV